MMQCRRVDDQYIVMRVSSRKYRVVKLDSGEGFYHGFTNMRRGDFVTPPMSHSEMIDFFKQFDNLSTPSQWDNVHGCEAPLS